MNCIHGPELLGLNLAIVELVRLTSSISRIKAKILLINRMTVLAQYWHSISINACPDTFQRLTGKSGVDG